MIDECGEQGVCMTVLKRLCRKFGIHKWPYKQSRGHFDLLQPPNAPSTAIPPPAAAQVHACDVPAQAESWENADEVEEQTQACNARTAYTALTVHTVRTCSETSFFSQSSVDEAHEETRPEAKRTPAEADSESWLGPTTLFLLQHALTAETAAQYHEKEQEQKARECSYPLSSGRHPPVLSRTSYHPPPLSFGAAFASKDGMCV
jgi:hypothetical protein